MRNSGCRFDFSEADAFLRAIPGKVREVERRVGEMAVDYAREHGDYRDVTGRLRSSNRFKADDSGLTVYNDAPYASDVEARGREVVSGAALYAEVLLGKECRR